MDFSNEEIFSNNLENKLQEILLQVEKPGRYIGNEINMTRKEPGNIRFAISYPDVYEVGMSHLGLRIIYHMLNDRDDVYCERVFAPWPDMEALMREHRVPLYALETWEPLRQFDIIGFTLPYEMCYTNLLNMLDLAGLPVLASHRSCEDPIICAGGMCAYNPEPLADFIDFFYLGEAETALGTIIDIWKKNKLDGGSKDRFLEKILSVPGIYVPKFYDVTYSDDRTIAAIAANHKDASPTIKKTFVSDLDAAYFPQTWMVPLIEITQDRTVVEVFRGCIRGCRFCQAGYAYRPVRERHAETLLTQAENLIDTTGYEEISLVSLSTSDYTERSRLITELANRFTPRNVNISLPSLRIDAVNLDLMAKTREVRKGGLTFAPEAGSQRLRDIINKGLTEEEILEGARLAFEGGWNRLKLYFMIGLPGETEEDVLAIPILAEKIVKVYYEKPRKIPLSINLSVACFVPKPFTPFQWEALDDIDLLMEKQRLIKKNIHKKQIKFSYHDSELCIIEAALARGDRRMGNVIKDVWKAGGVFESWSERFKISRWESAFARLELPLNFYTQRKRAYEEILPWDHIDIGISKEFAMRENEKAKQAQTTPNCRDGCGGCGCLGCTLIGGERIAF